MTDPTYELVEYRFENDNGDENNATFDAALNTALSALRTGVSNKRRARVQVYNDNNKVSNVTWQWECNNITASTGWFDITTSSSHVVAVASNSSAVAEGDNLTNRLTSRGSFDPDGSITVDGLNNTYNHAAANYAENSLVFYIVTANVSDGDVIQIRPRSTEGYTVTYTNTPQITVLEAATVASQTVTGAITPAGQTVKEVDKTIIGNITTSYGIVIKQPDKLELAVIPMNYTGTVLSERPDNLLVYYPLYETTGGIADNLEGTAARDGAYTGVDLNDASSIDNRPVPFFDGSNDYVDFYSGDFTSAFNPTSMTISAWVKVGGVDNWTDLTERRVVNIWSTGLNFVTMYKSNTDNTFTFSYAAGAVFENLNIGGLSYTDWFHVAMTVDHTGDLVTAYINGTSASTADNLGEWSGIGGNPNQTAIGAETISPTAPWDGWISDVAIWDRALTSNEVQALYNNLPNGVVIKQADKIATGSINSIGNLINKTSKIISGTITLSGDAIKTASKILVGSTALTGALNAAKVVLLGIAGIISLSGELSKQANKIFSGTIILSGEAVKILDKISLGSITLSGDLLKKIDNFLIGYITLTGALTNTIISDVQEEFFILAESIKRKFSTLLAR